MECEYCDGTAILWVSERYEAPDGVGAVERMESVCEECVEDVEPEGLDGVYARYEYKIEPIAEEFGMGEIDG